jgi:hypothetical protein
MQFGPWGSTPRRFAAGIILTSPTPATFHMPHAWAPNPGEDLFFNGPFASSFALPAVFPLPALPDPISQVPLNTYPAIESPTIHRQLSNRAHEHTLTTGSVGGPSGASTQPWSISDDASDIFLPLSATPGQSLNCLSIPRFDNVERRSISPAMSAHPSSVAASASQAQTQSLDSLHSAILQSLPADPSLQMRRSSPAPPPSPTIQTSVQIRSLASLSRGPSPVPRSLPALAPVDHSRGPSPALAPLPLGLSSAITSRATTPAAEDLNGPANRNALRAIRETDFKNYHQSLFIKLMVPRWHWYLLTENAFPIEPSDALEVCIAYAERLLDLSWELNGIDLRLRNHVSVLISLKPPKCRCPQVRMKESRIRGDFQRGVLAKVEQLYNVTHEMTGKIQELLTKSNFIYVSYNPMVQ